MKDCGDHRPILFALATARQITLRRFDNDSDRKDAFTPADESPLSRVCDLMAARF